MPVVGCMRIMTQTTAPEGQQLQRPAAPSGSAPVSRRNVLRWTAIAGGAAGVRGAGTWGLQSRQPPPPRPGSPSVTRRWSGAPATSTAAAGARCGSQSSDGTIVRVDPDNTGDDSLGTQNDPGVCPRPFHPPAHLQRGAAEEADEAGRSARLRQVGGDQLGRGVHHDRGRSQATHPASTATSPSTSTTARA